MKKILYFCLIGLLLVSGYYMLKKDTLTKEQQDNVAERIIRRYKVDQLEFTRFNKDIITGTYHLLFVINGEEKYSTGLSVDNFERFNNSTDPVGLNPVNLFDELKRETPLSDRVPIELKNIKIIYLQEWKNIDSNPG